MRIAIVGATGLVGKEMLEVLGASDIDIDELIPVASENSVGAEIRFRNEKLKVYSIQEAVLKTPDIALFSAGGDVSLQWAPKFAEVGTRVIDNSSAWRMNPKCKLIVPEVNGKSLTADDFIIANPNCSTIQLVMVLKPLHDKFGIKRVIISTYQAVTGTGKKAVDQLNAERSGEKADMVYPYPIDLNCIPHCDVFSEDGYTKEELKLVNEPRKILDLPKLAITATAVRVPVLGGHSESVNIEFETEPDLNEVRKCLASAKGVVIQDNPDANSYPMPRFAKGKDEVFVGRIRKDMSCENAINLWVVADNLRKGAATNAVQIAELIVAKGWIN
jgi:aspartate-semialdehyde dehydrogenase